MKESEQVVLRVFNVMGPEVARLVEGRYQPGAYRIQFKAGDLPSGMYFYQIQMGHFTAVKKMLLLE